MNRQTIPARLPGVPYDVLEVIRTQRRIRPAVMQWLCACRECGEHLMADSVTIGGGHRKLARRLREHKSHSTCERPIA